MTFFEPDVLVEAEAGLAESIGYGSLGEDRFETQLLSLDELYASEDERHPELRFGLSVLDAYRAIYETRQQFVLRDEHPSLVFNETKLAPVVEAIFGAFPKDESASNFQKNYIRVFNPVEADVDVEHWLQVFRDGATVPFAPTFHGIEITPRSRQDLSFFVFDHTKPADLIDYWNKRQFEMPVYPVPLCWLSDLAEIMTKMIKQNYRPIPNNSFGTKFTSTVYFGRSLKREQISNLIRNHFSRCPEGSFHIGGTWHPKVPEWRGGPICERHSLEVERADVDIALTDDLSISLDTLAPAFADRFGGGHFRWSNVVNLRSYDSDTLALTYPSNHSNRSKPRLFRSLIARPIISREGWTLGLQHKDLKEHLELSSGAFAIEEWLKTKCIEVELSSAGRIAKQMIESLGGLWGAHMVADVDTLRLLNNMATQEVTKGAGNEATKRQFEGRTVLAGRWKSLISKRSKSFGPTLTLEAFAKQGILKLGLGLECPNCTHNNWYGLDQVDYDVVCERCLKQFRFPQGSTSARWKYRVTGPFSVPNYAEGAYAVALTLSMFKKKLSTGFNTEMTFATGLNLKHRNFNREVDFAFWYGESGSWGQRKEPRFVVGEAKSFAKEAITARDIESLQLVGKTLPGTVLVVSVLKTQFSETERGLLTKLARWGWGHDNGHPRAPLILLTEVELFAKLRVRQAWEDADAPYPRDANFDIFNDLTEFAFATQKIHLGLDYYTEMQERLDTKQLSSPESSK